MIEKRNRRLTISTLILIFPKSERFPSAGEGLRGARELFAPRYADTPQALDARSRLPRPGLSMIQRWNEIAPIEVRPRLSTALARYAPRGCLLLA